MKIGSLLPKLL